MPPSPINVYRRQRRMEWAARLAQWRARRGESGFHAASALAATVLLCVVLAAQRDALDVALRWITGELPVLAPLVLGGLGAVDHHAARRRQRRVWRDDWVSAQPVCAGTRRAEAVTALMLRLVAQSGALGGLLALARAAPQAWAVAAAALMGGALLGWLAAARDAAPRRGAPVGHETPFGARGRGSLWGWQWIEAGASLAPRRVAWMLPVILLVPRGKLLMAGVALLLVLLLALTTAWQRALAVIPVAHRWFETQPAPARAWLGQAVVMPLVLLGGSAGLAAAALAFAAQPLLALAVCLLPPMGVLQLAAVMAERARPARAALIAAVQIALLVATLQAMPPLAPPLWLGQVIVLLRRSLRA